MVTVTCSEHPSEHSDIPRTHCSVTHSSCLIMMSLDNECYTEQCDNNNRDHDPRPTHSKPRLALILRGPQRSRGPQLTKQASLLSHLLENQELVSDPHVSPWTHVTHGDFWAGQSSSYLVEFTFSCETRMECSVSVSQGINRRSSAESRLSSSRDLLPKIRA